jgi:flagellar basal body-associated protein FliL
MGIAIILIPIAVVLIAGVVGLALVALAQSVESSAEDTKPSTESDNYARSFNAHPAGRALADRTYL